MTEVSFRLSHDEEKSEESGGDGGPQRHGREVGLGLYSIGPKLVGVTGIDVEVEDQGSFRSRISRVTVISHPNCLKISRETPGEIYSVRVFLTRSY